MQDALLLEYALRCLKLVKAAHACEQHVRNCSVCKLNDMAARGKGTMFHSTFRHACACAGLDIRRAGTRATPYQAWDARQALAVMQAASGSEHYQHGAWPAWRACACSSDLLVAAATRIGRARDGAMPDGVRQGRGQRYGDPAHCGSGMRALHSVQSSLACMLASAQGSPARNKRERRAPCQTQGESAEVRQESPRMPTVACSASQRGQQSALVVADLDGGGVCCVLLSRTVTRHPMSRPMAAMPLAAWAS